jgi:hypothetical protein
MLLGQGMKPTGEYTEASGEKSVPVLLCVPQNPQTYLVMNLSPQDKRLETWTTAVNKVLSLSEKCYMCLGVLYVLRHDVCAWMCYMCSDVLYVLGRATCAWMCCMFLDVLHVLGCVTCAWMYCMCLDVLHVLYVLGYVTRAWMYCMCYICLDVLYVLGCVTHAWMYCMCYICLDVLHVLGCISTLRLQTESPPECSSSRPYQFLLLNPLPVQFKSLLYGHEGCVFFSGHLNLRMCQYVWVRSARQATFKSSTFWYVRASKGLILIFFKNF